MESVASNTLLVSSGTDIAFRQVTTDIMETMKLSVDTAAIAATAIVATISLAFVLKYIYNFITNKRLTIFFNDLRSDCELLFFELAVEIAGMFLVWMLLVVALIYWFISLPIAIVLPMLVGVLILLRERNARSS